jgi:hypothetical protein
VKSEANASHNSVHMCVGAMENSSMYYTRFPLKSFRLVFASSLWVFQDITVMLVNVSRGSWLSFHRKENK